MQLSLGSEITCDSSFFLSVFLFYNFSTMSITLVIYRHPPPQQTALSLQKSTCWDKILLHYHSFSGNTKKGDGHAGTFLNSDFTNGLLSLVTKTFAQHDIM